MHYFSLAANNIIDFSNEGSSSQKPEVQEWEELKIYNEIKYELPPLHEKTVMAIEGVTNKVIAGVHCQVKLVEN